MKWSALYPPKLCRKCGQTKPVCNFGIQDYGRDRLAAHCKPCVSRQRFLKRKSDPGQKEADRKYNLRHHNRGMTVERYDELLAIQGGVCAICQEPETARCRGKAKRLAVDHCHTTEGNRGLLCARCNVAIGYFRESAELLKAAITYIQQYKTT